MTRFHCLTCGDLEPTADHAEGVHLDDCCNGRVIPIATLCNEPTVIDESDLATGMVVVAVDDNDGDGAPSVAWICTPDARLYNGLDRNYVWAFRQVAGWFAAHGHTDHYVLSVAGVTP